METRREHEFCDTEADPSIQLSKAMYALRRILSQETTPAGASNQNKGAPPPFSVKDLTVAFGQIAQIQEALADAHCEISPDFGVEFSEYKHLLKRFKAELPRLHGWLLAERARLRCKRSHSEAVENWVRTTRQTR